jgi:hypothetical protein
MVRTSWLVGADPRGGAGDSSSWGFSSLPGSSLMKVSRTSRSIGITTPLKTHPTNPTSTPQGGVYAVPYRKNPCRVNRPTGTRHYPTRGGRVGGCRVVSGGCRVTHPTRVCSVQDGGFIPFDPPCRVCRVGFWPGVFTHPSLPECGGLPGRSWWRGHRQPTPLSPRARELVPLPRRC